MIKLIEKSNFDDIEKAVKYYYNKWYYSDMSYDDIASDLKRLGHSDDFIDAVLDGISERYEDEEDYELDESIEGGLDYINSMNEEAVKHFHYGNSGESRRKETADRFGFDFTPYEHMITCKDGKVINIQIGKKYRCTSCNNQRVEIVDIDELFDDGSAMLDVAWRNKRYSVASTQIYESVLREKNVEIDVKHEGILEVPEGKNVDDLPFSHFEKLAKKKGLSKITKALNNLQVWNKNDDKKLSKWAGDMIDKLNKKLKKDEAVSKRGRKRSTGKSNSVGNFLDKQIESGNIDEKQVTVVYDKNNNIMWLGKAGFYPLYMSGIEYRSSGYDKDHPHEFWINARSYTEPFEENLSLKDVKRVNNRIVGKKDESLRESNSGGLDWSYLDPVLQEFIDWLEDDGIRVEKVNPRMKTIYVPRKNLEMASWYLRDRDYFGKEPFLKDWMVASRA